MYKLGGILVKNYSERDEGEGVGGFIKTRRRNDSKEDYMNKDRDRGKGRRPASIGGIDALRNPSVRERILGIGKNKAQPAQPTLTRKPQATTSTPTSTIKVENKKGGITVNTRENSRPASGQQPSPFGRALYIARLIKGKDDLQVNELREILKTIGLEDLRKLANRVRNEIMADYGSKVSVAALFPIAFAGRCSSVAHNTAATLRIIRQHGLTFDDLLACKLVEINNESGEARKYWHLNYDSLKSAAEYFRQQKRLPVAQDLEAHLRVSDEVRAMRLAQNAANAKPAAVVVAPPPPPAENVAAKPKRTTRAKATAKKG